MATIHEEDLRLAQRLNPELHIVTPAFYKPGWLSSLSMIYKRVGTSRVYHQNQRPPFPVIMDKPNVSNIWPYFQKGDLLVFGLFYLSGLLFGYGASRRFVHMPKRLIVFHGIAHVFTVSGLVMTFLMPCYRVKGYWDNGLRWRRRAPMKKYDFTKELYDHGLYKHMKVKLE